MGGIFGKARNFLFGSPAKPGELTLSNYSPYGPDPLGLRQPYPFATGLGQPPYPFATGLGQPSYYPENFLTDPIGGFYGPEYGNQFDPGYGYPFGPGFDPMQSMSPLNYGNYYLGNTTMQMIPLMKRKLAKFGALQALSGGLPAMPMMPMMPMMPCLPASFGMPMGASMMAAATPLPMAYNPIVQNMYPMSLPSSFNWMTPSSFMSSLSSGQSYLQPPASFQFPSNVGMVMNVPYTASNPLLAMPSFGGFNPQYNFGSGLSCCCCYCTPPPVAAPTITYYPRAVPVPQPCPVPCPVPVPVPNVQQVPVPRPVTVVAPPIVAGGCSPLSGSIPAGSPLMASQGAFSQGALGSVNVMKSNNKSTSDSLFKDNMSDNSADEKHISKSINDSRRAKAQRIAASLSNLGLNNNIHKDLIKNKSKHRMKSSHHHHRLNHNLSLLSLSNDTDTSDLDLVTSDTLRLLRKSHRKSARHTRSHRHRKSSISDHDCVACKHERHHKFS